MAKRRVLLPVGVGALALALIAASQATPVEALAPEHGVPGAQSVETVLRATYALPSGRSKQLAEFLRDNAATGIDVRLEADQLVVVASADAQKALGAFVDKCLNKEPRAGQSGAGFGEGPSSGFLPTF